MRSAMRTITKEMTLWIKVVVTGKGNLEKKD